MRNIRSLIAIASILVWLAIGIGVSVSGDDTITATVTAQNISVIVEDGSIAYGTLGLSSTADTLSGSKNDRQYAGNNGNVTADFTIAGTNTDWTLGTAAGSNTYVHQFNTDNANGQGDPWAFLTTSAQHLIQDITWRTELSAGTSGSTNNTEDFDLRVTTPSSTDFYSQQSVNVTVSVSYYQ